MTTSTIQTTPSGSLLEARADLANARAQLAQTKAVIAAAEKEFREANVELFLQLADEEVRVINADESLRAIALVEFERIGLKKLTKGVEIISVKSYAVDEAAGLAWAREHKSFLLPERLDVKAATKVAQTGAMELPFVTITESPSVRVASDLSEFVLQDGAA